MGGSATLEDNLVDDLVPVIDDLRRDLYDSMGTRQHEVHLVRRTWSGTERGDGVASITQDVIIDPPPLFKDATQMRLTPAGRDFQGDGMLSEVSLTYTEAELLGGVIGHSDEFYYRIVDLRGQGLAAQYFVPNEKGFVDREQAIGWVIQLHHAQVQE